MDAQTLEALESQIIDALADHDYHEQDFVFETDMSVYGHLAEFGLDKTRSVLRDVFGIAEGNDANSLYGE